MSMKAPTLWELNALMNWVNINSIPSTRVEIGGVWLPARPWGLHTLPNRLHCAYLVFTGRADAVIWPGGQ